MKKVYYLFIQVFLLISFFSIDVNGQLMERRLKGTGVLVSQEANIEKSFTTRAVGLGQLPYFDNFDSYEEYSMPDGWVATGTNNKFRVASFNGWKDEYSEPYCLVGMTTATNVNWVYSIGFNLEAGKTYYAGFWLIAPGLSLNDNKSESMRFTVGKGQSTDSECVILKDMSNIKYKEWARVESEFTPTTSGVYYFGIGFTAKAANGVGIDDFEAYDLNSPFPAQAKYITLGGLWSSMSQNMKEHLRYVYPEQPISFINQSKYAYSNEWGNTFGIPSSSTEKNPVITYSESGLYEPVLNIANPKYADSYSDTVNVVVLGKEEVTDKISNMGMYDKAYFPEDQVPSLNDFVSGINKYYTTIAERFELPAEATASISSISFKIYVYKASTVNKSKPIKFRIYGEKWNAPDPDRVLGEYVTTVRDALGNVSIDYENISKTITFSKPVEVKGSFYVSIEFDESIVPDATTKFSLTFDLYRADKVTSAYARLSELGASALGLSPEWYCLVDLPAPFDELDKTGHSFYLSPQITFHKSNSSAVRNIEENEIVVYPMLIDENLTIEAGKGLIKNVEIYNMNGQKIYEKIVSGSSLTVETSSWNSGVYIVKAIGETSNHSTKVVKL